MGRFQRQLGMPVTKSCLTCSKRAKREAKVERAGGHTVPVMNKMYEGYLLHLGPSRLESESPR